MNINVGSATTVTGAMMNSALGALTLSTDSLVVSDLRDNDQLNTTGGGFSAGYSTDQKGKTSPTGSINVNLENKDKQGITKGTIGNGNITVRSLNATEQAALIADINRDPAKFRKITTDTYDALKADVDLTNIAALGDTFKNLSNAAKQFDILADKLFPKYTKEERAAAFAALQDGVTSQNVKDLCNTGGYNKFNPVNWLITPAYAALPPEGGCNPTGKSGTVHNLPRDCQPLMKEAEDKGLKVAVAPLVIMGVVYTVEQVTAMGLFIAVSLSASAALTTAQICDKRGDCPTITITIPDELKLPNHTGGAAPVVKVEPFITPIPDETPVTHTGNVEPVVTFPTIISTPIPDEDFPNYVTSIKPPDNAYDPNGPKAPGRPGNDEGFKAPKDGDKWVKSPRGNGWLDSDGNVWIPSGLGGTPGTGTTGNAHGGAHWDVQLTNGGYKNVRPKL